MKNLFKSVSGLLISLMLILLIAVNSVYASGGSEGGYTKTQWFEFAWKTLDVIILGGFLYWMLAAKIKEFFVGRRQDIKDSMENAKKEKTESEKKYREYSEKIDKASHEIDGIIDMIKAQGVTEKQKIIEDAGKVAQKMKEDAQARIDQEFNKASYQLRSEAVSLSVLMAEEILKKNITAQDHEVMVKEYMDKVVNKN
ncbi:MAG: ATP synthase F0 subunit B [Deltaproteobacteria bacterium]|jgi:F-type H+-transporting ATPase subunit b